MQLNCLEIIFIIYFCYPSFYFPIVQYSHPTPVYLDILLNCQENSLFVIPDSDPESIFHIIMNMDKTEILGRTNLFSNISDKSRNALAEICLSKQVSKKQHLFFEDDQGISVYILVTGSIQLYKTSPDGREVVIRVVRPGELFGEVILFEQDHYPVSAVALKDSSLFLIPKNQFTGLLKNEDFSKDFFSTLMQKMRYLTERIKYLTLHDVEERLRLFLKEHYGKKDKIVPTISKKDIASSIGATPETFSRLINRLKREGKMEWKDNSIIATELFWQ